MKYFDELNELETSIIELELIKSNLRVVSNGMDGSNFNDVQSAIEHLTCCFENQMSSTLYNFQHLFDAVARDTLKTDYVQPSEGALELDRIVRGWSKA